MVIRSLLLLSLCLTLAHCSHDIHEKRADTIKDHVESFYNHLKHDRVAAAVRENEAIEHLSTQLGEIITRRVNQPGTNQVDREWTDFRTANETAAQNWLALGQYLSIKKQYSQARATYQRVMDTYTGSTDRTYRDQAARALRDLDVLNPNSSSQ
jgi:phage terminase small subunit